MIIYENECVGCDYCINCGRDKVPYRVCDECKEYEQLYKYDDKELCIECIKERLEKV
jgi:hypothetical protein